MNTRIYIYVPYVVLVLFKIILSIFLFADALVSINTQFDYEILKQILKTQTATRCRSVQIYDMVCC